MNDRYGNEGINWDYLGLEKNFPGQTDMRKGKKGLSHFGRPILISVKPRKGCKSCHTKKEGKSSHHFDVRPLSLDPVGLEMTKKGFIK